MRHQTCGALGTLGEAGKKLDLEKSCSKSQLRASFIVAIR
jgi:hypothetical protein